MKVLLVKPDNLSDHIQPSLGLGFLATQIRGKHEVEIIDAIKDRIRAESLPAFMEEKKPDVIGMQCYTFDIPHVHAMLKSVKQRMPRVVTVCGGAHISAVGASAVESFEGSLDYGFQGEAELAFPKLLDHLGNGHDPAGLANIPGLIYRDKDGSLRANGCSFIDDLDSLGMPSWDLIKPETYPESQHGAFFENFPIAPIVTTRGCPYGCTFCSATLLSGKQLRHHSVTYILEQIQYLYHHRGIREIHIVDDNFTMDKAFAKEVLRGIIGLKLPLTLATPNGVRMDSLDDELLTLMRQAGIYLVTIGVESGSDRVLRAMKKKMTTEQIRECCERIKKHGFDTAGFFILGFPGETREDIEATIKFSRELPLMRANFFTYLPLPGTESYEGVVASGEIGRVDWNHYNFPDAPYVPPTLTRGELLWLKKKAFLLFHLRPSVFWKNISGIKNWKHLKFLMRRFYRWIIKT